MIEDACVLLVDDDLGLRSQIGDYLSENGLNVLVASDAAEMDDLLATHPVNLIVLDLNLPGEGGLSICRRLAVRRNPAVIIASAAGDEFDRVLGLEIGADDYLAKPFSPRELLARVRSVLRRAAERAEGRRTRQVVYHFAGSIFEPSRRRLKAPTGANVVLTVGEAALLGALLEAPGRIVSREDLMSEASDADSRAVDLQISRLRRKLQAHGAAEFIQTRWGLGYVLDCQVLRA